MVVNCPECGTRFSLDESRVPSPTAKVRCSRCRHVFRITRDGQVLAPDWTPPEEKPQVSPPAKENREEAPAPRQSGAAEPGLAPPKEAAPREEGLPQPPLAGESQAPPERAVSWLWIPTLLLAAAVVGLLGWRAWQGTLPAPFKPLNDMAQRLKGKMGQPPPPSSAPAPKTGASAPAPTVVTPPPPPAPAEDLKDLPVDWAQARYQGLKNDKGGGQLLLIQGEIFNKGKTPRGPIRLKATLTDSRHQPLREEVVYAGTTFTDKELQTLKPGEIKGWLAKPGGRSQERVLPPGEKQAFTVLFFGVPDNLAETQSGFQIEVIEGPVVPD